MKYAPHLRLISGLCLTLSLVGIQGIGLADEAPQREGLPGRRFGGGTRGECLAAQKETLVALMPENNLGLTAKGHPTLFFSLPQVSPEQLLEFVLLDEQENVVYEKQLTPPEAPGILSLKLPEDQVEPLSVGQRYHWYFSLVCDAENRAKDIVVDGWIERVNPDPNLTSQIETASLLHQAELYQQADLWHDALAVLAQLHFTTPDTSEASSSWQSILEAENLTEIKDMLLINSSSLESLTLPSEATFQTTECNKVCFK